MPEAAQPASPEQQGEGDREGPSPAPGQTVIAGTIEKMPDGITRDSMGMPRFKVTIKADGKRYHAMTEGDIAERLVRDVKPEVGDDIMVIGRYVERPWEKEGKTYQVKEIHDMTRIRCRCRSGAMLDADDEDMDGGDARTLLGRGRPRCRSR